jgi:hypothetical protein
MVKMVSVDCEVWDCPFSSEWDCRDCPHFDPHEMEYSQLPRGIRGLFKEFGLVYEE